MLPDKEYSQNIFIEISNPEHGGLGWELGTCLWSPVNDKGNRKKWSLMEEVRPDDLILHLIKIKGEYFFYGLSKAISNTIQCEIQPPLADKWSDMSPYQRINLNEFNKIETPFLIKDFFTKFDNELRENLRNSENNFYVEYGEEKELRMAQKYFAKCSDALYGVFNDLSNQIRFSPSFGNQNFNIPTANEPQNPDYNSPGRVETTVSRIIRDTKLSKQVKQENDWVCQICGTRLELPNSCFYSEAHHLKPLGGEHEGPDIKGNLIVLCPNHHNEFDYGCIGINPRSKLIEHINEKNEFHGKKLHYYRTDLDNDYLEYHYKTRFNKL